jgi:hypothetical protein
MTIGDLVTRALQLAGVVGMNRAPSAAEMNDGIDTLNEMLSAWALDGMDLGLATLVQTDTDLFDPAYVKGVRYSLAVELAGAHGILNELPATVIQGASEQQDYIRAALADVDNLRADNALIGRRYGFDYTTGQ